MSFSKCKAQQTGGIVNSGFNAWSQEKNTQASGWRNTQKSVCGWGESLGVPASQAQPLPWPSLLVLLLGRLDNRRKEIGGQGEAAFQL